MRRPGIGMLLLLALLGPAGSASSAALAPSADPVSAFVTVSDSLFRTEGDAGLSAFVKDNDILAGAAVAKLLDAAFLVSTDNAAGAKENVDLAKRIAQAHASAGGSKVALSLVDTYVRWTPAQRSQRAKALKLEEEAIAARKAGDIEKALGLLAQARGIYEKIGDKRSVAVNWGTQGQTRFNTSEWDVVIADYDQALTARRGVEDRILEGRTLNGLGSAYQQKGDLNRALALLAVRRCGVR